MLRTATKTIEDERLQVIKHTDIHLRIRTLIAEAGRVLRTATKTIEDERLPILRSQPFVEEFLGHPLQVKFGGDPKLRVFTSQRMICYVALLNNQLSGSEYTESPCSAWLTSCAEWHIALQWTIGP